VGLFESGNRRVGEIDHPHWLQVIQSKTSIGDFDSKMRNRIRKIEMLLCWWDILAKTLWDSMGPFEVPLAQVTELAWFVEPGQGHQSGIRPHALAVEPQEVVPGQPEPADRWL
jgi:hypothetical protein